MPRRFGRRLQRTQRAELSVGTWNCCGMSSGRKLWIDDELFGASVDVLALTELHAGYTKRLRGKRWALRWTATMV